MSTPSKTPGADHQWQRIPGHIAPGHGVASGCGGDDRFPEGTLALQWPHFEQRGLDLSPFHRATINISIAPRTYTTRKARLTLRTVEWTDLFPPEDFSFFDCRLVPSPDHQPVPGLVYYPHPETKPDHFQDPSIIEILVPWINGIQYHSPVHLDLDPAQIEVTR